MYVCTCACVHFRVQGVHVCMCACKVCMCACAHVCMCACVHFRMCFLSLSCARAWALQPAPCPWTAKKKQKALLWRRHPEAAWRLCARMPCASASGSSSRRSSTIGTWANSSRELRAPTHAARLPRETTLAPAVPSSHLCCLFPCNGRLVCRNYAPHPLLTGCALQVLVAESGGGSKYAR